MANRMDHEKRQRINSSRQRWSAGNQRPGPLVHHRSGFSCDKCGLSLECFGSRPALKRHAAECNG
jgi:hypothetical protein